jgi:hypothetical protein
MESKRYLSASEMLNNGSHIFENSIIRFINNNVKILDVTTGKTISKDISFFKEILNTPTTVQQMLRLKGVALRKAKLMMHKKQRYLKIAEAVVRLKNDLH